MLKKTIGLICLLLFASSALLHASDTDKGTIFVVNSINNNELWTKFFSNEIIKRLENEGYDIKYIELNVPAIKSVEECDEKCEYLLSLSANKPKLVIYIGDPAWLVTLKLLDNQWRDVPTFICDYRDEIPGKLSDLISKTISDKTLIKADDIRKNYCVSLIDRPLLIKETILLMKELLPNMNKFVLLSDDRYISVMIKNDIEQIIKHDFPELKFELLTPQKLSVEKLLDTLSRYDETVGILYYSWFQIRNDNSTSFIEDNIHKVIYGFSKVPIFNLNDFSYNDDYFAGGCFIPLSEFVDNIIYNINNVINKPYEKGVYKVTNVGKSGAYLNYRHLLNHGVDPSLYPEDAIYYQAPLGFFKTYQVYIISGALIAFFAIILIIILVRYNIHKQKQRNSKLQLLNEYRKLVNNMPMVYMRKQIVDVNNYVLMDVNTAFEMLFDCKRVSVIGKELNLLITENPKLSVLTYNPNLYNVMVTDKSGKSYYFDRIILKDDGTDFIEEFWVDSTEEYKISQEREVNNLKINELNSRYELVLKAANFAIWEYDLNLGTFYCNLTHFLSRDIEFAVKEFKIPIQQFVECVHVDDRKIVAEKIKELVDGIHDVVHYEYRVVNYFGVKQSGWIECNAIVNKRDENGRAISIIGAATDISARKNLEEDLRNAKICAEESNLLKSAFLANMSHEIRTPLNAIVGFSNMLAKTSEESDRLEYLSIIETNNELLLRLVGDILDLSKIDAGLLEFEFDDVNVTGLFTDLEQEMNHGIKYGVSVLFDNHNNECILYTERNRLLQVIKNLLTNAIKFTTAGEIHFGYRPAENGMIYFYVSDSGCGIAKEQLKGVFERFVKLNAFIQGTGLGLSICKTIIARLGGEIGVESELDIGSTFWFTLPDKKSDICEEESIEVLENDEEDTLLELEFVTESKKKILIAEDVESNYKLFESVLRNKYELIHAWDGEEAVRLFKELKPDLILMDIKMPKMNGYEATEEIRKISDVIIIAITAFAFAEDKKSIMNSGFNNYITKPINAKQLREIIGKYLDVFAKQ